VAQVVPLSGGQQRFTQTWMGKVYKDVWTDFFKEPIDEIPGSEAEVRIRLKGIFIDGEWYEVYDLLEFMIRAVDSSKGSSDLRQRVQRILTEEVAGFRLMDGQFVEITDANEIATIEDSLLETKTDRFAPVHKHLREALKLFSDRRRPNYRNSIKESISAVEAVTKILTGNAKVDLAEALRLLRPTIHGALLGAFTKLYGFTSDADGIRHALMDEPNLDPADAKFMLVACSAFISYLIQKIGQTSQSPTD
jgi:hypothetical protein